MSSSDQLASRIRLNGGLFLLSALATSIQVIVFSCVDLKRLALFVALFIVLTFDSLTNSISYFAFANDATFLQGTKTEDQEWEFVVFEISGVFETSFNMIVTFICFNMFALLQLQEGMYRRNSFLIHIGFIVVSVLVGMVDFVMYLVKCQNECTTPIFYYGNSFSIFFVVSVGGLSVVAVFVKLMMNRVKCLTVMKQSSISPSLFYRMIGGIVVLIALGGSSISYIVQSTSLLNDLSGWTLMSFTGLLISLVFGTSQECLSVWQLWIKKYLGVDLSSPKNESSMHSALNRQSRFASTTSKA